MPRYRVTVRDSNHPRVQRITLIYSRDDQAAITWAKDWLIFCRTNPLGSPWLDEWEVNVRTPPAYQLKLVASGRIERRA